MPYALVTKHTTLGQATHMFASPTIVFSNVHVMVNIAAPAWECLEGAHQLHALLTSIESAIHFPYAWT